MMQKVIESAKERDAIPLAVFKPTGFGRFALYQKIGEGKSLSTEEKAAWDRVVVRFDKVCQVAQDKDVAVLIDGEESYKK